MYSISRVWAILFQQRPGAFGVTLEQMVTYGVLGVLMETLLDVGPEWYMAEQVRTGRIDTDLTRPVSFYGLMLAMAVGEMLFNLGILALPGLVAGALFLGVRLPADLGAAGLFALSAALGFLVLFHIAFLMGTLSVVTLDIRSFVWAYYSLIGFFAGQMVPLWLFPQFLRSVAQVLPFQSIYFIPMSIYVGTLAGADALRAIGLQVVWAALLAVFARWAWTRVHRRLVVQGG
jgi:ABC-type uncharacterized transport system permease subunit